MVRLLAARASLGQFDQPGLVQHPDVEVQMTRVDAEPLGELAIGQRLVFAAELFEHAQAQWVSERLQLLGLIDGESVAHEPISNRSLRIKRLEICEGFPIFRAVQRPVGRGFRPCGPLGSG